MFFLSPWDMLYNKHKSLTNGMELDVLLHTYKHTERDMHWSHPIKSWVTATLFLPTYHQTLTHAPLKEKKECFSPLTFFVIISVLKAYYASCHIFKKVTLNPLRALCDATWLHRWSGRNGVNQGFKPLEKKWAYPSEKCVAGKLNISRMFPMYLRRI